MFTQQLQTAVFTAFTLGAMRASDLPRGPMFALDLVGGPILPHLRQAMQSTQPTYLTIDATNAIKNERKKLSSK